MKRFAAKGVLYAVLATGVLYGSSAYAQTFRGVIEKTGKTLARVIGLLFIIATIVFFVGIIRFIANSGDPVKRQKSKALLWWGIVGLAVIVSAWGITTIIVNYFQIPDARIQLPRQFPKPLQPWPVCDFDQPAC